LKSQKEREKETKDERRKENGKKIRTTEKEEIDKSVQIDLLVCDTV
jgi:hypothetical protein